MELELTRVRRDGLFDDQKFLSNWGSVDANNDTCIVFTATDPCDGEMRAGPKPIHMSLTVCM